MEPGIKLLRADPHPSQNFVGIDGDAIMNWALWWIASYPKDIGIYEGQRAQIEHVLHEIGHAVSLGIALPCYDIAERIGKRLDRLPLPAQRYNEALVLAAEIWMLAELGNDPPILLYLDNADGQGCLPELEALRGGVLAAMLGRKVLRWLEHGKMLTRPA